MTGPEAVGIGLGFLAIVAPDFWPKMPRPLSYALAAVGLSWLTYSAILAIQDATHMKLQYGPLAAIIMGAALIAGGIFWHISRLEGGEPALDDNSGRLQINGFRLLQSADRSQFHVELRYENTGKRAVFTPQRQSIFVIAGQEQPQEFIDAKMQEVRQQLDDAAYNRKARNQIQPGVASFAVEDRVGFSTDQVTAILQQKAFIYFFVVIKYAETQTPSGYAIFTSVCLKGTGTLATFQTCQGDHNKIFLAKDHGKVVD